MRQVRRARQQVIRHGGGGQVALVVVDGFLEQRLGDALGQTTVHLAVHDERVHHVADVVHGHVGATHLAGLGVDLRGAQVRPVRVGEVSGSKVASGSMFGSTPSGRSWAAKVASAISWMVLAAASLPGR